MNATPDVPAPKPVHPGRGRSLAVAAVLALIVAGLAVAPFWPIRGAGWVNWDDDLNLTQNQEWRGLSGDHLRWIFTTGHAGVHQPLGWLAFAVQHRAFGAAPTSWPRYHQVSLAIHALNAALVFLICLQLIRAATRNAEILEPGAEAAGPAPPIPLSHAVFAALAALLFAVHPLRAECVAWLSCQPYLWAGLFGLLAVWVYLLGRQSRSTAWSLAALAAATLLFGASLLSKAIGIALPAVLLLLDFHPLRRHQDTHGKTHAVRLGVLVFEKLPMLAIAWYVAQRGHDANALFMKETLPTWSERGIVAVHGLLHYLHKTVAPLGLSPQYDLPAGSTGGGTTTLIGLSLIAAFTLGGLIGAIRNRPGLLVTWLAFLALIAPVLGFVWHGDHLAADRYTYLACLPWAAIVGIGLAKLCSRSPAGGAAPGWAIAPAAAAVLLGMQTVKQTEVWKDSTSLWRQALAVDADSQTALVNLGLALASREVNPSPTGPSPADLDEAVALFTRALAQKPANYTAWKGLGIAYAAQDKIDEAIEAHANGLRIKPNEPGAINFYGGILSEAGRHDQAAAVFEQALTRIPADPKILANLGLVYFRQNRWADALEKLDESLKMDPRYALARFNRGRVLDKLGRTDEALAAFAATLEVEPAAVEALVAICRIQQRQGRWAEAWRSVKTAYKFNNNDLDTLCEASWILAVCPDDKIQDGYKALQLAARALTISRAAGNHVTAIQMFRVFEVLGAASAANGQFDQAVDMANKGIALARDANSKPLEDIFRSHLTRFQARQTLRVPGPATQPANPATSAPASGPTAIIPPPPSP